MLNCGSIYMVFPLLLELSECCIGWEFIPLVKLLPVYFGDAHCYFVYAYICMSPCKAVRSRAFGIAWAAPLFQ